MATIQYTRDTAAANWQLISTSACSHALTRAPYGHTPIIKKLWLLWILISVCILLTGRPLAAQRAPKNTAKAIIQATPGSDAQITASQKIRGHVTDIHGVPVMDVNIQTIPKGRSCYSDSKGNFTLLIDKGCQQLLFAKKGYATKTIAVKNIQLPIQIRLSSLTGPGSDSLAVRQNNNSLQEVVITGYGAADLGRSAAPVGMASVNQMIGRQRTAGSAGVARALEGKLLCVTAPIQGNAVLYGSFSPGAGNESYAHTKEGGFTSPRSSPFSTFSIDVDKASYSNVRRFIEQGSLPPADAVRVEELINYFDYQYAVPAGPDPVAIRTELSQAPWSHGHYLLQIGLQAKKIATDELPASNLVFLIDVSGSMDAPDKLPLLISSFKMLTDQLRGRDHVSIVTYAGYAQRVLEPTAGDQKQQIKAALDGLRASGSTNGQGGLQKAYAMAEKYFNKHGNNRIILASDGDFNVGASSLEALEKLITEKRKSGIFLSVLGFGMGNYKDDNMELLADKGNGNYAYIDNSAEAHRVLLKEFGGTLFTIAKDVKVQVEFNPDIVAAYRLIGYENRALRDEDFNRDTVDAGEMGSGSTVTALYEIIPKGYKDDFTPEVDSLRYCYTLKSFVQTGSIKNSELGLVKIRYKTPAGQKSKLITRAVQNSCIPLKAASGSFQLAAAAAGWGMLLKNSDYKQSASFDGVEQLIQKPLSADKTGQVGQFLNLVQTSRALIGNEVKAAGGITPPVIRPAPAPYPMPRRHPERRKSPPVVKILPVEAPPASVVAPDPAGR